MGNGMKHFKTSVDSFNLTINLFKKLNNMDYFKLAQEINILADPNIKGGFDVTNVKNKGNIFCRYFKDNAEDITNNERASFHIGSAMYFYLKTISNEKESQEYKFALLVASINLYEAFKFGDIQSVVSAYRLHLILVHNPEFFNTVILSLINDSAASLLSKDSEENTKGIRKFMSYIEYCLFMYCQQDGAQIGWLALHDEEKIEFQNMYAEFMKRYKVENFDNITLFDRGNKWLNALINTLINNNLESYKFLGVI